MPPENLPAGAKKIYNAAEANARKTTCKDREDKDACVNKIAWSAVKKKYKKVGDKWMPKAELASFSMAITNTSYDKATDTRRWKAVASDTDEDLYNDNMTRGLYDDFLQRIESGELPPESFRSDFWDGGVPYLSVSHYPDLNGKGVPGPVDVVYVDGEKLKASGRFDDTPIGKEVFKSISKDLSDNIPDNEKIRISIAFLDWMHKHKSNGFVFDRSESEDPICPECLKEFISGEYEGKEFLRGQLVHLALTRVPVNTRTSMEVERSMTTRKEDAESIIGEELAEELDEEALLEGKSQTTEGDPEVIIKAEEPEVEEKRKKSSDYVDEEDEEEEDEMKKKKKKGKEEKAEVFDLKSAFEELKAEIVKEPEPVHPLDIAFSELKAVYDEAVDLSTAQESLQLIQEPFEALATVIQDGLSKEETSEPVETDPNAMIAEALAGLREEFGLLRAEFSTLKSQPQAVVPSNEPPAPRNIRASNLFFQPEQEEKSETPKLRSIARQTVGLDN
jgi:cation transport regulator